MAWQSQLLEYFNKMSAISEGKADEKEQRMSKPDKTTLKLSPLPKRCIKDKVTAIGHVFRPSIAEIRSKLFHLRYSPKDDCYYQYGSNDKAIVKGWRNGTNVAVNVMRRIGRRADIDLKWAYLTRYPGRQSGSISWKFDFTDTGLVVDAVTALTYSRTLPGGLIRYDIVSPDTCQYEKSSTQIGENNDLSGLKTLILVAYLDGQKTNQTQTQLLYHEWRKQCENKQMDDALPFEIIIKLKDDEKCTCPEVNSNDGQLQCTCAKETSNNTNNDAMPLSTRTPLHYNSHRRKSLSTPSLVELKSFSDQSTNRTRAEKLTSDNEHSSKEESTKYSTFSEQNGTNNGLRYSRSLTAESYKEYTRSEEHVTQDDQSDINLGSRFSSSKLDVAGVAFTHARRSRRRKCSQSESLLCTCYSQSEGKLNISPGRKLRGSRGGSENGLCTCCSQSESQLQVPSQRKLRDSKSESKLSSSCDQSEGPCSYYSQSETKLPTSSARKFRDSQSESKLCSRSKSINQPEGNPCIQIRRKSLSKSETNLHDQSEYKKHEASLQPKLSLPDEAEDHRRSAIPPSTLPQLQTQTTSNHFNQSPTATKRKRKKLKLKTSPDDPHRLGRRKKSPGKKKSSGNPSHQKLCRSQSAPLNYGFVDDDDDVVGRLPSAGPSPSRATIANSCATMSVIQTEPNVASGVCSVETKKVLFTRNTSVTWDGSAANGGTDDGRIDKEALVTIDCSEAGNDTVISPTRTCTIL